MHRTTGLSCVRLVALSLLACSVAGMTSCMSYYTWPPVRGQTALSNPNIHGVDDVMSTSMKWLTTRFPPAGHDGLIALNLPQGLAPSLHEHVAESVGPRTVPLTRANANLPVYHVKFIEIRGSKAEVQVLRPVLEAGPTTIGEPMTQGYTLYLEGGLHNWRVERWREWTPGTLVTPALAYVDTLGPGQTVPANTPVEEIPLRVTNEPQPQDEPALEHLGSGSGG